MNWWLLPLGFLFDFLYIVWFWAAEKGYALLGGLMSVSIVCISITGIFQSLDNRWNLLPYMLGLFLGSFLGIKIKKWKTSIDDIIQL